MGLAIGLGIAGGRTLTRPAGTLSRGEREELGEQGREGGEVAVRQRLRGEAAQAQGQASLVLAVAAQVEQAVFEYEWAVGAGRVFGGGLCDPARGGQGASPVVCGGQRGGDAVAGVEQEAGACRVEAGVAAGHRQRGQGGAGQDRVGGVRVEAAQAVREGVVQRAQGAGAVEGG